MELSLDCEVCGARVVDDQDYILHLKFSHDVMYGLADYVNRAYKIKRETITLDEDQVDEDQCDGSQDDFDVDLVIKREVEQTIDRIFEPIKSLVNGNSDGETFSQSGKLLKEPTTEECWEELNRIKESVTEMTFPWEALQELNTLRLPQHKPLEIQESSKQISDSKSSESSSNSSRKTSPSFYHCPMARCNFKINKKQMRERENAKHLQNHHKITQKQYDSDRKAYNFTKI